MYNKIKLIYFFYFLYNNNTNKMENKKNKMCEIIGSRVKKLINAETDQNGYAWAKSNENVRSRSRSGILLYHEYVKFKPNKLKFDTDKDKWYHYDFAPEFVSNIKPIFSYNTVKKVIGFDTNIVDIEVMSIEEAQQSTRLKQLLHAPQQAIELFGDGDEVNMLLIKRSVYKNGIFKFIMLKLLVMKYCSYIREKTWKPGSLQYQLAKERFNNLSRV